MKKPRRSMSHFVISLLPRNTWPVQTVQVDEINFTEAANRGLLNAKFVDVLITQRPVQGMQSCGTTKSEEFLKGQTVSFRDIGLTSSATTETSDRKHQ